MPHCGQNRSPATSEAPQVVQEPTRAPQAPQKRSVGCRELPQLAHAYGVIGLTGPVVGSDTNGQEGTKARRKTPPFARASETPETVMYHRDAQESKGLIAHSLTRTTTFPNVALLSRWRCASAICDKSNSESITGTTTSRASNGTTCFAKACVARIFSSR